MTLSVHLYSYLLTCTQFREIRAAKEAMDAKREKMSSYDIWMEAARGMKK